MTDQTNVQSSHWQSWANVVLGIWLFFSPWILQFASYAATAPSAAAAPGEQGASIAAWNAWVLGVIVFLVALGSLRSIGPSQERINLVLGAWIFIAPWVLGFAAHRAAAWDHWIVGALIFLVSASDLAGVRTVQSYRQ